jgi:hypothetical protein
VSVILDKPFVLFRLVIHTVAVLGFCSCVFTAPPRKQEAMMIDAYEHAMDAYFRQGPAVAVPLIEVFLQRYAELGHPGRGMRAGVESGPAEMYCEWAVCAEARLVVALDRLGHTGSATQRLPNALEHVRFLVSRHKARQTPPATLADLTKFVDDLDGAEKRVWTRPGGV